PTSQFAVIYPSPTDSAFVVNPNELIIVDLARPPSADPTAPNPVSLTLRSFGGKPQGFTFTPALELPGGTRRLLLVRTSRDVSIIDLNNLQNPEITVGLTGGSQPIVPAQIAVSDGLPGKNDDARYAVRADGDSNIVIVDLLPLSPGEMAPQTFRAAPNVVFA